MIVRGKYNELQWVIGWESLGFRLSIVLGLAEVQK